MDLLPLDDVVRRADGRLDRCRWGDDDSSDGGGDADDVSVGDVPDTVNTDVSTRGGASAGTMPDLLPERGMLTVTRLRPTAPEPAVYTTPP
jgi:hypothetical protein